MESLKFLYLIYIKPSFAFSEVMDKGSWPSAAMIALAVSAIFFFTVNSVLDKAYSIPAFSDFYTEDFNDVRPDLAEQKFLEAEARFDEASGLRKPVPMIGDRFLTLFSFDPLFFFRPSITVSVLAVPFVILVISIFGGIGSFGLLMRREYAATATCFLLAFAAAYLPASIVGLVSLWIDLPPEPLFYLWLTSGAVFIVLSTIAVRTVFGVGYSLASVAVLASLPAYPLMVFLFGSVSILLFSPFLLIWALVIFGALIGGEIKGLGDALRQKQNFKRFLQNATVNPRDADAHVQLGLIYLERRQDEKAAEHFQKAFAIDSTEIDANFQLGKLARKKGELQVALDHFSVVVEQDDKFQLSEIWREIGIAYLSAEMWPNAYDALERFVERRPVDPEGLYYFGKVLKVQGESERAKQMFEAAIESAHSSPHYRRRQLGRWVKLAAKEI